MLHPPNAAQPGARVTERSIRGRAPQHAKDWAPRWPHTSIPEAPQKADHSYSCTAYSAAPSRPAPPLKRSHIPINAVHCPAKTLPPVPGALPTRRTGHRTQGHA
ncbi:hypothetical protein XENOCAPTIV_001950 [Xenoophorus captivus]|uniref:Uncharacterized protein n=1 Tax=Xenoophorus captivus TaxID=1517983 RepID=A0ABV0Q8C7_9TELE